MPRKRHREMQTVPYKDASSGFVKMYHYKEPFMKFEEGFGFRGALLFDSKTDQIQCHICGDWFNYLPRHIRDKHKTSVADYKLLVGLRKTAVLISETTRNKMAARGMERRKQNLVPGLKDPRKTVPKIRATLQQNSETSEFKNEHGTCPLQLIDRLKDLVNKLQRTPKKKNVLSTTLSCGRTVLGRTLLPQRNSSLLPEVDLA